MLALGIQKPVKSIYSDILNAWESCTYACVCVRVCVFIHIYKVSTS